MSQDAALGFLEEDDVLSVESKAIAGDLKKMAETLTRLEFEYVTLNEKAEQAKKIYDEFRCITLPNAFRMAGFNQLVTTDGAKVSIQRKYYCSPNKNEEDQNTMCNWLKQVGAEDLIKQQAIVDKAQIPKLVEAAIPHTEKRDVNTTSLKAWLKRALGEGGNVASIKLEDIPQCMHFVCLDEAVVEV